MPPSQSHCLSVHQAMPDLARQVAPLVQYLLYIRQLVHLKSHLFMNPCPIWRIAITIVIFFIIFHHNSNFAVLGPKAIVTHETIQGQVIP